jgi:hypothetical protein
MGNPLALDEATKKRTFGHFARILVDVDLNSNLRERILVQPVQVEDVHVIYLAMKQSVDQQTPILGFVGSSRDIGDFGHRMYTYEEENAAAINYLKNRAADREEPFTEVVFKGNKKKGKPVITRSRGRNP